MKLKGKLGFGDIRTWTALCADTKLVPCWIVGEPINLAIL